MWELICIFAEGLLNLICLVGLVSAIGIVFLWVYSAYIMYHWMYQQSGHGLRFVQKGKVEDICRGLSPESNKSENVVKKTGVM